MSWSCRDSHELERGREPGAAVEIGRLPAAGVPEPRGVADLLVRAKSRAVLVEPLAQLGPLADQGLVGHLDGAVVERDEALLGEPVQERLDRRRVGALRHELADGDAPARVVAALAELGHADQDAADQPALLLGQRVDEPVGGAADGRCHAAGLAVTRDGERAAVAVLPGGAQRVREQRQRARLGGDVAHDQLDQAGLELQPGEPGRLGDRALELAACPSGPSSTWLSATASASSLCALSRAVEVGAHSDRDRAAQPQQRVDERPPAIGVVGQGEELLELVDDDESVRLVAGVERGRGPGRQQRGVPQPSTWPARTSATTPARSTEDLPLPDAPTTASSLPGASRSMIFAVTASRPKKKARRRARTRAGPGTGTRPPDGGVLTPGPVRA